MTIITLYRYEREQGKVTTSIEKPDCEKYTELYRIIADEGKIVTLDGENFYSCIDVEQIGGWYEVDIIV